MPIAIKKLGQKGGPKGQDKVMPLPKKKPRHASPKHRMNTEKTKPLGQAGGGKLKMVEKGGKKVPFFAADGVGKMAKGGPVKVKSGDTLSQIAKSKGVTLKALLGANPNIKNANQIRVGQTIKIPTNMPGSKSSNPYADIKRGQMADMDVKNKSEKRQRRATRSMQTQVKQGGSRTTPTPSRAAATKESKSGREAMLAKARKLRDSKKAASKLPKQDTNRIASTPASKLTETRMARLAKTNRANRRMGGGSMKKVQGYKSGGVVRGAGAATRGKGFNRAG
jgi:LysM repeat protein